MDITITRPIPVLLTVIGDRNISTTASSLVSGHGSVGVTTMAGAVIASVGTTVGMATSGVIENGEIVNSVVDGVMIVPVVNGMTEAVAGSTDAVAAAVKPDVVVAAGIMDTVAKDMDAVVVTAMVASTAVMVEVTAATTVVTASMAAVTVVAMVAIMVAMAITVGMVANKENSVGRRKLPHFLFLLHGSSSS
jgi:hypothetical protein